MVTMPRANNSMSAILAATVAELAQHGSGALRVDAVAQRAGVNKRMIYHHFGDRQGLLDATFGLLTRLLQAPLLLPYFANAFALSKSVPEGVLAEPPDQTTLTRILLAEYCRQPRIGSESLLTLIASDTEGPVGAKPRFRVTGVSRVSSPAADPP